MAPSMLRVEGACLDYGGFRALSGVDLHAGAGELIVLLGANGAGKSSIFGAVSGLHRLAAGSITLEGRPISRLSPAAIVRSDAPGDDDDPPEPDAPPHPLRSRRRSTGPASSARWCGLSKNVMRL